MRKFHVHINVASLTDSIAFYSELFAQQPSKLKPDYAKWDLQDPPLNFAISVSANNGGGVNHLGLEMSADDLANLQQRLASMPGKVEQNAACCYAVSDKLWLDDPNGLAWESFHTKANDAGGEHGCCNSDSGCH